MKLCNAAGLVKGDQRVCIVACLLSFFAHAPGDGFFLLDSHAENQPMLCYLPE
jgi:hypothetical protein